MAFRVPQGYSEFPECRRQGTEERQCEDAPHTNVTTLAYNAQDQLTKFTAPDAGLSRRRLLRYNTQMLS